MRQELAQGDGRFIAAHPHAAMITVGADGLPKAVKMEAAVVSGVLESASHADKVRTRRLRRDPRCTLYFADDEHRWLTLEAEAEIVEGPGAPARLLRYFRIRDGKPTGPLDYHSGRSHHSGLHDDAFQQLMADEDAVLYRFTIIRAYGSR
jgi:hypothetical protein